MKYITIIRHAKSSWDNVHLKDIDRPLAERGLKDIPKMGNYLLTNNIAPDIVLSSPANRAFSTAKGICATTNYPIDKIIIQEKIYYGSANDIVILIEQLDNLYNDVFVFGHEPKCSYLIEILTGEWINHFPTCAVFRIAFDCNDWKQLNNTTGKKSIFCLS